MENGWNNFFVRWKSSPVCICFLLHLTVLNRSIMFRVWKQFVQKLFEFVLPGPLKYDFYTNIHVYTMYRTFYSTLFYNPTVNKVLIYISLWYNEIRSNKSKFDILWGENNFISSDYKIAASHVILEQEAHGPHRSPEEDFYMFSISFYKLDIISPCRRV